MGLRRLASDERGATFVEFTIMIPLVFVVLLGMVEFLLAFVQWNLAVKAVERGARIAVTSDPVDSGLNRINGLESGASAQRGDSLPFGYFAVSCSGQSASCAGVVGGSPTESAYDPVAMNRIVFGHGVANSCSDATNAANVGMCDIFGRITPANVVVEYRHTGLGFVGRPSPVPTVTVSLRDLFFEFFFIGHLLSSRRIAMPDMRVTMTGEDLRSSAYPAF
jgi:Flp pilus assembly protein TadG